MACLCAACGRAAPAVPEPAPYASATPYLFPTAVATVPLPEHILSLIPSCQEIEILDEPVPLVWPNAEQRIEELEGSRWGYFHCPHAAPDVSAFYQAEMIQPPYNNRQVVWVSIEQGTLGLYYHSSYHLWTYLWVLPPGPETPGAYVLVAQANSMAFEPDC